MPKRSLSSVKITSVRRTEVAAALKRWADRIAHDRPEVLRIGYFGSYARGDYTPFSDLDVVVVLAGSPRRFPERTLDYQPQDVPVGCEVFAYTADEIALMRREGRSWWHEIETTCLWVWTRHTGAG